MGRWWNRSGPRAVLVGLGVAVVLVVAAAAGTSGAAFSAYNYDWEGTSEFRSAAATADARFEVATDSTAYASARSTETVAFVLSPETARSRADRLEIAAFVRNGGTLVVADQRSARANALLEALNASARLDGRPLRDGRSNYASPAMPVATEVSNHPLVAGVESVTLNHGTVVRPNGATVLVESSEYAYLDADRNGRIGRAETFDSRPVATVESVGDGRVVVVSDSSVFINGMADAPGNRAFLAGLLAGSERVLLDHSDAERVPPVPAATSAIRDSSVLQVGVGVLVVGALAVWSWRPALSKSVAGSGGGESTRERVRPSRRDLVEHLERRHPEWDRERVERVVAAVRNRSR